MHNHHQRNKLACHVTTRAGQQGYLVQPHDSPLKDGQGLWVDGLSMVCPASQDVPPAPVSLSQGDAKRVWQEQQSQNESNHIECGGSPELVPATVQQTHQQALGYP